MHFLWQTVLQIVLPQICLFSPTLDMVIQTIQGMPQWQGWWCLFIIIYSSHICCLCFQPKSMTDILSTSVHGNLTKATHPRKNTCFRQASMWFGPVTWLMAYWPVTWPLTHTFHTRFHMIWNSHPITDIHISHMFLCDSDQNHQTATTQSSSLHKSESPWKFWVISLTSLIRLQHTFNKLDRNKGSQVPGHNCNGGKRI